MAKPYSMELRERAMARLARGETTRQIAEALSIAPSTVSKWKSRERETGSVAPGQMGGHKVRTLSGEIADWLRRRMSSGPAFTLRSLSAELAERGVKTESRAVWVFLHDEDLSFKKNFAAQRADPA
jgi:putative transposase